MARRLNVVLGHVNPTTRYRVPSICPLDAYGVTDLAGDLVETTKFIYDGVSCDHTPFIPEYRLLAVSSLYFQKVSVLWMIRRGYTTADFWEEACDAHRDRLALIFADDGSRYTYGEIEKHANQVAAWGLSRGLKKGDVVALFMENRPEYIFLWLGLAKLGVATALINSGLQGASLAHCVRVSGAAAVVIGSSVAGPASAVMGELPGTEWLCWCGTAAGGTEVPEGMSSFDAAVGVQRSSRPPSSVRKDLGPWDLCWYIYTSGTTGLPKAARINHTRLYSAGLMYAKVSTPTPLS